MHPALLTCLLLALLLSSLNGLASASLYPDEPALESAEPAEPDVHAHSAPAPHQQRGKDSGRVARKKSPQIWSAAVVEDLPVLEEHPAKPPAKKKVPAVAKKDPAAQAALGKRPLSKEASGKPSKEEQPSKGKPSKEEQPSKGKPSKEEQSSRSKPPKEEQSSRGKPEKDSGDKPKKLPKEDPPSDGKSKGLPKEDQPSSSRSRKPSDDSVSFDVMEGEPSSISEQTLIDAACGDDTELVQSLAPYARKGQYIKAMEFAADKSFEVLCQHAISNVLKGYNEISINEDRSAIVTVYLELWELLKKAVEGDESLDTFAPILGGLDSTGMQFPKYQFLSAGLEVSLLTWCINNITHKGRHAIFPIALERASVRARDRFRGIVVQSQKQNPKPFAAGLVQYIISAAEADELLRVFNQPIISGEGMPFEFRLLSTKKIFCEIVDTPLQGYTWGTISAGPTHITDVPKAVQFLRLYNAGDHVRAAAVKCRNAVMIVYCLSGEIDHYLPHVYDNCDALVEYSEYYGEKATDDHFSNFLSKITSNDDLYNKVLPRLHNYRNILRILSLMKIAPHSVPFLMRFMAEFPAFTDKAMTALQREIISAEDYTYPIAAYRWNLLAAAMTQAAEFLDACRNGKLAIVQRFFLPGTCRHVRVIALLLSSGDVLQYLLALSDIAIIREAAAKGHAVEMDTINRTSSLLAQVERAIAEENIDAIARIAGGTDTHGVKHERHALFGPAPYADFALHGGKDPLEPERAIPKTVIHLITFAPKEVLFQMERVLRRRDPTSPRLPLAVETHEVRYPTRQPSQAPPKGGDPYEPRKGPSWQPSAGGVPHGSSRAPFGPQKARKGPAESGPTPRQPPGAISSNDVALE